MRVMVIVKSNANNEAGALPTPELLAALGKYNDDLQKAGVMLGGEGLHPSSRGARVRFRGEHRAVVPGPFPDARSLVAGYWLWHVESLEEAIAWAKRCPNPLGEDAELELRPVMETEDLLPPDQQADGMAHLPQAER